MMTIRHITAEGESTFGAEKVLFVRAEGDKPDTLYADLMPLQGGKVYVMNERGSTVASYTLGSVVATPNQAAAR